MGGASAFIKQAFGMTGTNTTPPSAADHPNILGYCETCQTAYRIGWHAYSKIAESVTAQDLIRHNLDIKIRHKHWNNPAGHLGKQLWEHSYQVYDQHETDFVIWGSVRICTPIGPHKGICPSIPILIDMPIRKEASHDIRALAERTVYNVIAATSNITPNSWSAIDTRDHSSNLETRITIVIGDRIRPIAPPEKGWYRSLIQYHKDRAEPSDTDEASIQIEPMEIDYSEAQPQEAINPGTMTTQHGSIQITDNDKHRASKSIARPARARRHTVPLTPSYMAAGDEDDQILLHRKVVQRPVPPEEQLSNEAGPSRRHHRGPLVRLREEAQQEAESVRTGNL